MSSRFLIHNGLVVTGMHANAKVYTGGLIIQDGVIAKMGTDRELEQEGPADRSLDAQGRLIMPGFINAHMHLYSTLARGINLPDPPVDFSQMLEKLWWRLDRALTLDDLSPSAEIPMLEALQCGVTTLIDHHSSPNAIDGCLDVLADSARKLGIRLATCYEVSDRDGAAAFESGIAENLRFAQRVQNEPTLAAMFGMHASFTLSDESLQTCAQHAAQAGLPCHIHVAEAASDLQDARARGARGVVDRLLTHNALPPKSVAAHCVHTHKEEWEQLRQGEIFVVHNPGSNMNNAVGSLPVERLIQTGVSVGIGTDGMQADVREDLRLAFLLAHHRTQDPQTLWAEISPMMQSNNRLASLLFGCQLGEIAENAAADVVIFDYFPPTPLQSDNLVGHLLFGLYKARAHSVWVGGKLCLHQGEPTSLDRAQVAAQAQACARRLWQRF